MVPNSKHKKLQNLNEKIDKLLSYVDHLNY